MRSRTCDKFLPFLLLHPPDDTNPVFRDEVTCDDTLPAIVETSPAYLACATRITEVKHETHDDQ